MRLLLLLMDDIAGSLMMMMMMGRILFCECVSFNDVELVLRLGGVKMSKKLLGHFLDQQGITHLGVGSVCGVGMWEWWVGVRAMIVCVCVCLVELMHECVCVCVCVCA